MSAPRESEARAILKSVFGYDDFRPGQWEVIEAALGGRDVFAVMPTGSGKSMCYQLPALVAGGLTLVVSPLIALMRDQVGQLVRAGVSAASLNSMNSEAEAAQAWDKLNSGELRLLFVSPERLAGEGLVARLRRLGVTRLAIDEAHCVSQWGHDFRPEYRLLSKVREALGDVPVTALTATADRQTRDDIAQQLFPQPPHLVVHSFDRPNLKLAFAPKDQPRRQIDDFLKVHRGGSGIVYCSSRSRTERLAEGLREKGWKAYAYHAGLEQAERNRNQDIFLQEDGVVVCATIAFGMGINKPDVRFVVHADMPGSIESYYQEIGRAGRDGLPADTLTLYGVDDMALRRRQIDEKQIDDERRRIEHKRLNAMIDLCESALCRRSALLSYFGEAVPPCRHGNAPFRCDLCGPTKPELADATLDSRKLLSAVARSGQRFGASHLADILTGTQTEAIRRQNHDGLKTFGVGNDKPKGAWMALTRKLFAAGALAEASSEHGGFCLTGKGEDILFGREPIALRVDPLGERRSRRGQREAARADGLDGDTAALFEHLRQLRLTLAREEGVAAYIIFTDRTLIAMARERPPGLEEMRAIEGVGERKLAQYGEVFLDAIATFSG
ncbi:MULTISPECIES: DNA helicase RecQ [unclassified Bosea (in: a-proteobacteria)]|uniref:DNA helicase RecQ n=1 Tax=unclassified Bosea (in: a-proteobacteria) TaxID=2653178 RepID=UPI000F758BEA|nr:MULTISPECIES: DNA helicase RecQ [unclassified Bosea (in: a-proteobacteria)]AZO79679.1 ATP-dependent DNA helicase RecQ [Bosea sp. Tri-49]RXT16070.1 DNA helicase RecQ [Bosea sp. Tri-39]RXT39763.1 DNA helicase RecQ [Bosea sp. Tri-54]